MKKLLFILLFVALAAQRGATQCGFSITFDRQAEVDAFPAMYPDCVDLDAYFYIKGGADITNLDSLQQLRSSSNRFWIENCPNLTDISGLRNIKTFNDFRISGCASLTSLRGLEQVRHFDGLNIGGNAALPDLISFDSLESVGGIAISGNPALAGLGHFPRLKSVSSHFSFIQNNALQSIAGAFPVLEHLPQLTVDSCANFTSFSGLDRLRTMNTFQVWRNHKLQNFNGLDSLRNVWGSLVAQDLSSLQSLEGMPNLQSVRDLTVRRNANLEALPGLPKNGCVNAQFTVQDCPRLKSFEGMEGCVRSLYNLRVSNCDSLRNLRGLDSLRFLADPPAGSSSSGAFSFYDNALLENLEGLESLDSSALGLGVWDCPNFQSFEGLKNLRFLGQLAVYGCPRLKNLHGLEALRFLTDGFFVYENDSLETLDGIGPVVGASNGYVSVHGNPRLSKCDQVGVCNLTRAHLEQALSIPAYLLPRFEDNLPGCNHYTEVLDSCAQNFSGFSGRVFMDAECDTLPGGTIVNLPHQIIRRADGTPVAATNNAGVYLGYAQPGADLTLKPTPIARYHVAPDSHFVAAAALPSEYLGLNFKFCPDFDFNDLRATLAHYRPPVPGFQHRYRACVENRGTKIYDANLTLDLSSQFDNYLTIKDLNGGQQIAPNVVAWSITDLQQFKARCFVVRVELSPGAPIGEILPAKLLAEADPLGPADIDPANNLAEWPQRIVASYDPNDKTVLPEEVNLETNPGEEHLLTYTVRFQNTGTFPASFIEIVDTLPENLDIRSIEMRAWSHNCRMIFPDSNVVKWRFDNINLPDSASNEAASHGYVQFSVRTKPPIWAGSVVENRVGIYFDFNSVVLTNFAKTRFYLTVAAPEAVSAGRLRVFPNPAAGQFWVEIHDLPLTENCLLEIADPMGRVLRRQNFTGEKMLMGRGDLPGGLLFLTLKNSSGAVLAAGRAVSGY